VRDENGESVMMLAPVLTPHGMLVLRPSADTTSLEEDLGSRLEKAFAKGAGHGLLPSCAGDCMAHLRATNASKSNGADIACVCCSGLAPLLTKY
jgi:hypothetical protein